MARWILVHIPHIVPALVAFGVLLRLGLVMADTPPAQLSDDEIAEWRQVRMRRQRERRVRRPTSVIGLIALPLLVLAFATGLWMYTLALRDDRPGGLLVWLHVIASLVGLTIIVVKLAEMGGLRLRRGLDLRRALTAGASLLLAMLGLPLAATGFALIYAPSSESVMAYLHLITSVWWGVMLTAHVGRYLGRAVDAALRGRAASDPGPPPPSAAATRGITRA